MTHNARCLNDGDVEREESIMQTISLSEFLECIESHLEDEVTYCMEVSECADNTCKLVLLDDDYSEKKIETLTENMYVEIYDAIMYRFCGNVGVVKVHAVFSGDWMYLIVHNKVCITLKFAHIKGQEWIASC